MTTFPLATLAAQITPTGVSAPSYSDILESLKASFRSIYGSDAYLEPDSQDGQWLAVIASGFNDQNNTIIATYNSFSPATAKGVGLSSVVKINGIARLVESNSTVDITIVGQAGTVINGGIVADENNNRWDLLTTITIPISGQIVATAVCETAGAVEAAIGTVTTIITPSQGWQTVTNETAAVPGAPVENDATLRVRQSVSTSLPAQSISGAILGAVENISSVQQARLYDNDTDITDGDGIRAHSIAVVTQGGDAIAIATAIASKKPPGTGTFGSVTEIVEDQSGLPATIKFSPATQVAIGVHIFLTARAGYVSTTGSLIKAAVAAGNSNQGIGGDIYLAKQYSYANLVGTGLENTFNVTSVELSRDGGAFSAADVTIAFDELAGCDIGDINLTVT